MKTEIVKNSSDIPHRRSSGEYLDLMNKVYKLKSDESLKILLDTKKEAPIVRASIYNYLKKDNRKSEFVLAIVDDVLYVRRNQI